MSFPVPEGEEERLEALATYNILNTISEQEYDDITQLAAHICNTSMSSVALVDKDQNWYKAKYGFNTELVPREFSICSYTILDDKPLIVNDTHEHEIFQNIGMVTQPPYVRFYVGVPLINKDGFALGTLCVIDTKPKKLNELQCNALVALSRQIIALLELRKSTISMEQQKTKIEKLNQKLTEASLTDDLTGLWNRRVLNKELKKELSRGKRNNQRLAFMMLDIDGLKNINDNHGHVSGDDAIKKMASLLKNETRDTDFCIRVGGDEFIVLMPNTTQDAVNLVANRIQKKFSHQPIENESLTVSIGVSIVENYELTDDALIKTTDECLYKAKHQGKNCVVIQTI